MTDIISNEVTPEVVNEPTEDVKVEPNVETPEGSTDQVEDTQPSPEDVFERRFRALTSEESKMRQREAKLAEQEGLVERYKKLEADAKNNPLAVLEAMGMSWDDVLNYQLEQTQAEFASPEEKKIAELENKLKQFEEFTNEAKKKEEELQMANQDKMINDYIDASVNHLQANIDKYPYAAKLPNQDLVKNEILATANAITEQTGTVPTADQVLEVVNEVIEAQIKPFLPQVETEAPLENKVNTEQTLTPTGATSSSSNGKVNLTPEERFQRAIQALSN